GVYDGNVWDLPTAKRRTSSLYKGRTEMGLFVFRRCSKSLVFGWMQRKRSGNLLCWKRNGTTTTGVYFSNQRCSRSKSLDWFGRSPVSRRTGYVFTGRY